MAENNEECTHDCSSCSHNSKTCGHTIPKLDPNKNSKIEHIVGVVSGKGGVGKSLVSGLLASKLAKTGKKVGILDADITGPSVPKMFGLTGPLESSEYAIFPKQTSLGIKIVSTNLMLEDPSQPVAWRGPVITGVISQFFAQVD